ncbi:MAG TPA: hypothetical protein VNT75_27980, partial [Symbiobacteriaceae bacterium]|nr:hypothetical protein [Symbiobacteriaceae bacterium]
LTTPALSFPPGPSAADLTAARKASPNTSGKPDALDLALLRMADQKGDHAAVKAGVQEAMAAGVKEPLIAYLAVKEGVLKPADVLGWELGPALLRWVQDRAGLEGAPPAVPVLRREGYYVGVALADPDGDIADWGLKVWLQPNESLTPILAAPGHDEWQYYNERSFDRLLEAPQEAVGSEVWARAWVVDGRGHRQETGLVRLAGPEAPAVAAPEPVLVADPDPTPAAPATPSPSEVRRANPLGWYLLGAFALIAAGAAAFRRLRK